MKCFIYSLFFLGFIHLISSQNTVDSGARNVGRSPVANVPFPSLGRYDQNPIMTAELAEYRRRLMYEYMDDPYNYLGLTSNKPMHDQPLPFRLPFFGFDFNYVYIQRDGYLSFNKGLLSYEFPLHFPTAPVTPDREEDPSIIAPWLALQDMTHVTGSGVYLKVVNIGSERNQTLRDRIILDFREGMIGAGDFTPKYALIVTWRNMTFISKRPETQKKTNTYQAVIATDEIRTYAMFNYEQIEWITHMDNYDGMKGHGAFIGFNAGNTTRAFEFRPYSQNPRISLMTQQGYGNSLPGRFFFQVDEEVWPGACIDKALDPNLPDRMPLTFFPRYGHMLGGTMVNITGPCLRPNAVITCKFENWKVRGIYRDDNHATCISPPVMYHGYVDLTVSVDSDTMFLGRFYIQPPEVADEGVVVLDDKDREENPDVVPLQWNPYKLGYDMNAPVTLSLWGYRESQDLYPSLTYIDVLAEGVKLGDGKYDLSTDQFKDRWIGYDLQDITFGYIAMNLTNPQSLGKGVNNSPVMWSRTMPIAWYMRFQWEKTYGYDYWKKSFCSKWFDRESFADRYATTVFRCPCTKKQAILDKGRFSPDLECNIIDRRCETFHRGALECFRSGRPSIGGSGQKCCYDDHGELIQTADTMYGGRPARSFIYGKHPFKMRMMIPALSNWLHDEVPYFFCCKWNRKEDNSETCQMYNYWRTSQDCSSYQSPGVASTYGDPHFITFDGTNYTFNGKGEFTLTHVDNAAHKLDVQARFEQVPKQMRTDPLINATYLTAIAAMDNQSSVVEFRVRPAAARWRYHMYVIVDKEYVHFWDDSLRVQYFKGVTLYQPAGIQNVSHVIAMFDSGAGVEVMTDHGRMTANLYLPRTFLNATAGLFGFFDKDSRNDLQVPNTNFGQGMIPSSINPTAPLFEIHTKFGMKWRLLDGTNQKGKGYSLFWHDPLSFSHYDDADFLPEMEMPPRLPDDKRWMEPVLKETCGSDSSACLYDFISTMDVDFAKITKSHDAAARLMWSMANETTTRCPALSKPMNGRKTENRYYPGTTVRFACDDGYRLVGHENRFCREDGLWSWGGDAICVSTLAYMGTITGVTLGIAIPVILIIVCTVVMVFKARKARGRDYYTDEPGMTDGFNELQSFKTPLKSDGRDSPASMTPSGRHVASIATSAREADI